MNNKGAAQTAQAGLSLCCSQTSKDMLSNIEARMIPIVCLHLNWIGLHAFLKKDIMGIFYNSAILSYVYIPILFAIIF